MNAQTPQLAIIKVNTPTKSFDSNVTLWEFLLELLLDKDSMNLISWTNREGEFRLHQSEEVARLWGLRKKRNNMNYDKLSRALRYYYDKNIIQKVAGKKFVYQFVTFPENFSKSSIVLPPEDFLKRVNSVATTLTPTKPTPQLNTEPRIEVLETESVKVESVESSTTLEDHVRPSDVSRKRPRNQYDFVSNQKEQEEIQAQIRLLDMYNDLLVNPLFQSNGGVPISFEQFVMLTYSIYQQNGENKSETSDFGSSSSSPQSTKSSKSDDQPLDLSITKKFKLEPIDL